jgi:hypothetical protein
MKIETVDNEIMITISKPATKTWSYSHVFIACDFEGIEVNNSPFNVTVRDCTRLNQVVASIYYYVLNNGSSYVFENTTLDLSPVFSSCDNTSIVAFHSLNDTSVTPPYEALAGDIV